MCTTIGNFGRRQRGAGFTFAPVADDDTATVDSDADADGVQGLQLTGTGGGWFDAPFATPVDLSARRELSFASPSANGSFAVSFRTGPGYAWCQGDARPTDGRPGVYVLDLTAIAPGCPALNDVRTVNLYIGGNQTQTIDAVTVS